MKIINFIDPINPQDIRACALWFKFTLALLLLASSCIAFLQYTQIRLWYTCRQKYTANMAFKKQYDQISEEKKKLEKQEQELQTKVHHIHDAHNAYNIYIEKINTLQKLSANHIQFVSCALTSSHMEITLNCPSVEQAQECCTALSQKVQGMHIASITPEKHALIVTCKN